MAAAASAPSAVQAAAPFKLIVKSGLACKTAIMSRCSETDSPLLCHGVAFFGTAATRPCLQNLIFNEAYGTELACGVRESLSVRSVAILSPFVRSRPSSPISERDPPAGAMVLELPKSTSCISAPATPDTVASRHAVPLGPTPAAPAFDTPCIKISAGVQTTNLRITHPRSGLLQRKKRPRPVVEVAPQPPSPVVEVAPPRPGPDAHLRSKISKLRAFWGRGTRLLPSTFRLSFLCPDRRQSEFLDFSRKEILLEEHHQHGPRSRAAFGATDPSDSEKRKPSPWADRPGGAATPVTQD